MFLKVYRFKILLLALLLPFVAKAEPAGWAVTETPLTHTIIVPDGLPLEVNGEAIVDGDFIGVFFFDGGTPVCGGYVELGAGPNDNFFAFGAFGLDPGFTPGESFVWKVYDTSEDQEFFVSATYSLGGNQWFGASSTLDAFSQAFIITADATPAALCAGGGDVDITAVNVDPVNYPVDAWEWFIGAVSIGNTQDLLAYPVSETTTFTVVAESGLLTATASVTVTVTSLSAGADDAVCKVPAPVLYDLMGEASADVLNVNWTTSGDGFFSDPTSLTATYTAGANDLTNGTVTLTITGFSLSCGVISDEVILTFQDTPEVEIVPDFVFSCVPTEVEPESVDFTGLVTASNYDEIQWASINSLSNVFLPADNVLEPTFFPSPGDVSLTFDIGGEPTKLLITASAIDPCVTEADDQVDIYYVRPPAVDLGAPVEYCVLPGLVDHQFVGAVEFDNNPSLAPVAGSLVNTVTWTHDGDGFFDDPSALEPVYTFGPNDLAGATITFTVVAETEGICGPVEESTTIKLQPEPTVDILPDSYEICEGDPMPFAGLVEAANYADLQWFTTNGSGVFDDETILEPTYFPSPIDIATFKATGECVIIGVAASAIDPCTVSAEDFMDLCFALLPVVVAGDDATICSNETYTTSPTVENSNGPYEWTHDGLGTLEDATSLNATYVAVKDDAGSVVTLTLTAQPIDPCSTESSDSMELTILCAPDVWAGDDFTVCETVDPVLVGDTTCVSEFMWATTGDGYFCCPDDLETTYYPGPADLANGCVTLVLVGYPEAPCSLYELDKVVVCFDPAPVVDAGGDQTVCQDDVVQLNATAEYVCGLQWVTFGGSGTFSDDTALDPVYTPSLADIASGSVVLTLIGAPCGECADPAIEEVTITFQLNPVAFAGADATICEDGSYLLADATAENFTSVMWSGGLGSFDDATMVNATYTPDAAEYGTTVELCLTVEPISPCVVADTDCMNLFIQELPTIDIIPDTYTICEDGFMDFTGHVTGDNYSELQWFTTNGSGVFDDETILEPTYFPSPIDINTFQTTGECVIIGVAASPISPCTVSAEDFMDLCFQLLPVVDAGDDLTTCEETPITITATGDYFSTVAWSGGAGTFVPVDALVTEYTPAAGETGNVVLTITAQPISPCAVESVDEMTLFIQPAPMADAGADGVVCEMLCNPPWTNGTYVLSGMVENNDGFFWSTSGDGTFSDINDLNATYTLGDADILAGSVELCLTAEPVDPCLAEDVDCMVLSVQPFPVSNAGPDQTVCEDSDVQLDGSTEFANGVFWDFALYGEGDGTWNNQLIEDPIYTPGPEDILAGYVELIMVAFPINPCTYPDADNMTVYITRKPVVDAGGDETLCAGETLQLDGSAEFATGGVLWTTSGDGMFDPSADVLDPVYIPGAGDIAAGTVELCLEGIDGPECAFSGPFVDCLTLTILPPPVVFAGADAEVCEYDAYCITDATADNVSSVEWTTSGDGMFDDATAVTPCYTPGASDIAAGTVTLTMTGYPLTPCVITASDEMVLTINLQPAVGFCFNGDLAGTGDTFEYCFDEVATVTLCEVWEGEAPFDIEYSLNGDSPVMISGVNPGDILFSDVLPVGSHVVDIVSITDANGCAAQDVSPYTANIIVNPEPVAAFCFNGDLAATGSVFEYCYDETVEVTLCSIVEGEGPFTIEWTVNGDPFSGVFAEGDALFSDMLAAGTYDVVITSIVDNNGCAVADVSPYMATVVINPEPAVGFCFNGDLADTGDTFEFCFDEVVEVTLCEVWAGEAPFDIEYSLNGDTPVLLAGVNPGDVLFSDVLPVGAHVVTIVSITDANDCAAGDVSPYTVNIIVNPEPDAHICVNGDIVGYGDMFEFCYDEVVEISLCEILSGEGPFEVCWTLNGGAVECATLNEGDFFHNDVLPVGDHVIELVSITDANGCELSDVSNYVMYITINPEPIAAFCFNGDLAATGSVFEYCYDETVEVTLCSIVEGEGPFTIEWTVNGDPGSGVFGEGDVLFSDVLPAGTYDVQITSIVDNNGCVVADVTPYMATVIVNPEPDAHICVNGDVVGYGDMFEFCYDEVVEVTLCEILSGVGPFEVCWTLNGGAVECATLNEGEAFYNDVLPVGDHVIQLVSMTDANGCSLGDVSNYVMYITINPEPFITFAVNGTQVAPGFAFEFCYDELIEVSLFDIWTGVAPFEVCYEVTKDGAPFLNECVTLNAPGDILNSGIFDAGVYELTVTSLTDGNGCAATQATLDLYTGTITVNPEPDANFCVNGDVVGYGDMFEFCYDEVVEVSMCEILSGEGPFEVCWTLNGGAVECATLNEGELLYNDVLPVGDHVIELVSLTDANGCVLADVTNYVMYITINPEPVAAFCFNGELAATGSVFEYCETTEVDVTLCEVVEGTAPFAIEWTVNGDPFSGTFDLGESLFTDFLAPGSYAVVITSIVDANGCAAADLSGYSATVEIQAEPTVDAGADLETCEEVAIQITGSATDFSSVEWSGGLGSFDPVDALVTVYTPAAGEVGDVVLTLTAQPVSPCAVAYSDDMTLSIQAAPVVDAGQDAETCEGVAVMLSGSADNYSSVMWSGGTGTFDPVDDVMTEYTPGAGENGIVVLTLTAQPIGPCAVEASDSMELFIRAAPTADAGADQSICDTETAMVAATVANYSSLLWTTSGDGFFFDELADATEYVPGFDDISAGSVELCIIAEPISPCTVAAEDCMTLTIIPSPTAFAGATAEICESAGEYELADATATNYSALEWTTSGDGNFSDATALNPIYFPGAADIAAGTVTLCLTAEPLAGCTIEAQSCMVLTIVADPSIVLDPEQALTCDNYDFNAPGWLPIELAPVVENAVSVEWTTSGDGFFDNPNAAITNYNLGPLDDKWNGSVTLTLTAYGSPTCGVNAVAEIVLLVPQQIIQIEPGTTWRGISSYVGKETTSVPDVMEPVVLVPGSQSLVIMINKGGEYYWPEPSPPINQLGNWQPVGYKAKFKEEGCLPIYGDEPYDWVDPQTFTVSGAFTYVPVLSNVPNPIETVFAGQYDNILLIYEWETATLWTPDLPSVDLMPGRAYLLVSTNPTVTYDITYLPFDPNYGIVSTGAYKTATLDSGNTPWNDVVNTSKPHFILFADEAMNDLQAGDYLGAFNSYDECVGIASFEDRSSLLSLIAMGNDELSGEVDGFEADEYMTFKLYRSTTDEVFDVSFTYDAQFPNYNNLYAENGVSKVTSMTITSTSVSDLETNRNVNVYPNPASDFINVASDYEIKSASLVNYVGQTVHTQLVNGYNFQIGVSNYVTGIYFVRLETTEGTVITKRVSIE